MIREIYPYPAYKPSGVPWIGDVPEHWDARRFKVFYREVDERSTTGSEELMSVSHKTGVTPRKRNVTMFLAESNVGYKVCRPGDIVINTMWAYMAALGVAWQKGLVSPSYGVYRPLSHSSLSPDYIDRLLRTEEYRTAYLARSTGITDSRLRLYPEQFLGIPLVCPPLVEQTAIVRYLNHTDRRIRRYVSAKRKLIALYEEEKQAIINQAVTRGLDPNVKLKPSGVEWLGDVPAHWEVRRLRTVAEMRVSNVDKHTREDEISVRLCNYVDVYKNDLITPDLPFMSATASRDEIDRFRLNQGDVLITKDSEAWDDIGVPALAEKPGNDLICGYHLALLRPRKEMTGAYLVRALQSKSVSCQFHVAANGVTRYGLTHNGIQSVCLPLPTFPEQATIVEYLNEATSDIDASIARARRQIELLEEYRTRLVVNVVTGKLDVREEAARLPEESGRDGPMDDEDLIMDSLDDDYDTSQPPEAEEEAIA